MTPHQAGKLLEPIKDKPTAMMAFVDLCEENELDMRWLLEVPEHARYKKWLISLQLGVLEVKDIYPWMPIFIRIWGNDNPQFELVIGTRSGGDWHTHKMTPSWCKWTEFAYHIERDVRTYIKRYGKPGGASDYVS